MARRKSLRSLLFLCPLFLLFSLLLPGISEAVISGTVSDISVTSWTPDPWSGYSLAVLKLDLWSKESTDVFTRVTVRLNSSTLQQGELVYVDVYRDENNDGEFQATGPEPDVLLGNGRVTNPPVNQNFDIDFDDENVSDWEYNDVEQRWECTYFIVVVAEIAKIDAGDSFNVAIERFDNVDGGQTNNITVYIAGVIFPNYPGELTRQDGVYLITYRLPSLNYSTTLFYLDTLTPGAQWTQIPGTIPAPGSGSLERSYPWDTSNIGPGLYRIRADFTYDTSTLQYYSQGTIRVVKVTITSSNLVVPNQGILSRSGRTAILAIDINTQTGYGNRNVMILTGLRCRVSQTCVGALPNRAIASVELYRDYRDNSAEPGYHYWDTNDFDRLVASYTGPWNEEGTTDIYFKDTDLTSSETMLTAYPDDDNSTRFYLVVRTSDQMEPGDTFTLSLGSLSSPDLPSITLNDCDNREDKSTAGQYPGDWNFDGTAAYHQPISGTKTSNVVTCEQRIVDMTAIRSDQGHGVPVGALQTRWWNDYASWGNRPGGQGGPYWYSQWTYNWFGAFDHAYPYGPEELEVMRLTAPYPVLGLDLAGVAAPIAPLTEGREHLYKIVVTFEDTYPEDFDPGKLADHPMAPHPNIALYRDNGDGEFNWRQDTCIFATEDSNLRLPPAAGGHIINNWDRIDPDVDSWQGNTLYKKGDYVKPTVDNGYVYECFQVVGTGAGFPAPLESGRSGGTEPDWPTDVGEKVTDGGVIWVNRGTKRPPRWRVTMYIPYENSALEATADGKVDFFIAISSAPDHQWVTRTPPYGMNFRAYIEESEDDNNSFIQFNHMFDPITANPVPDNEDNSRPQLAAGGRSKLYRDFRPSERNNGDQTHLPVPIPVGDYDGCKEARTVFSIEPWYVASEAPMRTMWTDGIIGSTDPVDADGWPVPVLAINMCDSNYPADGSAYSDSETFEWIRVWFKGTKGFKPTDLAPLSDNEYSGVSLWQDSTTSGTKGLPEIFIRGMHQFFGYGPNPPDTCVRLSADSLQWYNYDGSPWSPENDDPGGLAETESGYNPNKPPDATEPVSGKRYYKSYYVILKPKTAIQLYPDDLVGGSYAGYDYYICVRGRGTENARYSDNWWERGIDAGDIVTAFIKDNKDIQFGSGLKASIDPVKAVHRASATVMPIFFTDLTQPGQTINPQQKTAVIGYNIVAPPGATAYLSDLRVHILDQGTLNFDITDLISLSNAYDPLSECNDPNGGCGIALYKDDGLIPGVFDSLDSRVKMRAIPTLESHPGFTGDPGGPWIVHL
ncbi:MAG: hypothetical protein NC911_03925, partial [Candidatus Omnitrophica bacterium]|nr:hypothetical protein [Candidatus Omnitrophota bacterium]